MRMGERFQHFIGIDWSGALGSHHRGISMAIAHADGGPPVLVQRSRGWSREEVLTVLRDDLPSNSLVGFDLGISLPFADCGAFFPGWTHSPANARALWALVEEICRNDPNLEATSFVQHPQAREYFRHGKEVGQQFYCDGAGHGRGRFRETERKQEEQGCRPTSNFNLVGASQVGKSSLTGMRLLHALDGQIPVWPIDPIPATGSVVVEIYSAIPSIAAGRSAGRSKVRSFEDLNEALRHPALASPPVPGSGPIDDHASDALLTAAWLRNHANRPELWAPEGMTHKIALTEGWTFGVA